MSIIEDAIEAVRKTLARDPDNKSIHDDRPERLLDIVLAEYKKRLEAEPPPTLTVENSERHGLSYCMTMPEDEDRFVDDEAYQVAEGTERIFWLIPVEGAR